MKASRCVCALHDALMVTTPMNGRGGGVFTSFTSCLRFVYGAEKCWTRAERVVRRCIGAIRVFVYKIYKKKEQSFLIGVTAVSQNVCLHRSQDPLGNLQNTLFL